MHTEDNAATSLWTLKRQTHLKPFQNKSKNLHWVEMFEEIPLCSNCQNPIGWHSPDCENRVLDWSLDSQEYVLWIYYTQYYYYTHTVLLHTVHSIVGDHFRRQTRLLNNLLSHCVSAQSLTSHPLFTSLWRYEVRQPSHDWAWPILTQSARFSL